MSIIYEFSKTKKYTIIMVLWFIGLFTAVCAVFFINEHLFIKLCFNIMIPYFIILMLWYLIEIFKFRKIYKNE